MALAFKTIGKMLREKREKHTQRQRRSISISSSERTRTNSEVSTTSTVDETTRESRRYPLRKLGGDSSGRRSPHSKLGPKQFVKSSASPSILRHPASLHTSGRHVEFSALSPVPSDGSDSEGKDSTMKEELKVPAQVDIVEPTGKRLVKVEVHPPPVVVGNTNLFETTELASLEEKASLEVTPIVHEEGFVLSHQQGGTTELKIEESDVSMQKLPVQVSPAPSFCRDSISDSFTVVEQELSATEEEDLQSVVRAIVKGDMGYLEKCLEDGCLSVNASDISRRTLLHHAVAAGNVDAAQLLLKR